MHFNNFAPNQPAWITHQIVFFVSFGLFMVTSLSSHPIANKIFRNKGSQTCHIDKFIRRETPVFLDCQVIMRPIRLGRTWIKPGSIYGIVSLLRKLRQTASRGLFALFGRPHSSISSNLEGVRVFLLFRVDYRPRSNQSQKFRCRGTSH